MKNIMRCLMLNSFLNHNMKQCLSSSLKMVKSSSTQFLPIIHLDWESLSSLFFSRGKPPVDLWHHRNKAFLNQFLWTRHDGIGPWSNSHITNSHQNHKRQKIPLENTAELIWTLQKRDKELDGKKNLFFRDLLKGLLLSIRSERKEPGC